MQIIANSPAAAHVLDVTRTVSRAALRPTGIDRIEQAYIRHLIADPGPLFGLARTRFGYLLLDKAGCSALLQHCARPVWNHADLLSRLSRKGDPMRGKTETGLRRVALDRAVPSRLTRMLGRHVPPGAVYLNTGQTNFNDTVIHALRACADMRIAVYMHDTIPLDWPEMQTPKSRLSFKRFFARVDRHADTVLCNSQDTRAHVLSHATRLDPDRVLVLWPGVPQMDVGVAPEGQWQGHAYFLAIGTIEPRKNIGFLLDIWDGFDQPGDPQLILCGRRGWMNEDVFARLDRRPANVHELPDLDDAAMWALLQQSAGLLFPSLAEGFGYPAIEAACLNVPLICNPLPVFQEVLGEYPIYLRESDRYLWKERIGQLAQRRRGQGGEQTINQGFSAPQWQAHFNQLFTVL